MLHFLLFEVQVINAIKTHATAQVEHCLNILVRQFYCLNFDSTSDIDCRNLSVTETSHYKLFFNNV